jgi:hypothetical protein
MENKVKGLLPRHRIFIPVAVAGVPRPVGYETIADSSFYYINTYSRRGTNWVAGRFHCAITMMGGFFNTLNYKKRTHIIFDAHPICIAP